jgi:methyl-accepting chemotaxis protein
MMDNRQFRKRRHYLIDKRFQLKYAAGSLTFVLIAFFIFTIVFYQVGFSPLLEKLRDVYPEARLFDILGNVYKHLSVCFLLLLVVTFGLAIFRSHKIAGPIFRLKQYIHQMSEGDFASRVSLRKKDELKTLSEELNILSQNIGFFLEESRNLTQRMQLALDELHKKMEKKPDEYVFLAETLSRLEGELEQFREILRQYKI